MSLKKRISNFLKNGYEVYLTEHWKFNIWIGIEGNSFEIIIPEPIYYYNDDFK